MTRTSAEIVNARRIAFGQEDQLMDMSKAKYPWAEDIYTRMENNTWFPKSIPMNDDRMCYRSARMSDKQRKVYDRSLAFVSNLDGIQFNNLVNNIGQFITDPLVRLCVARQAAEEGVHVRTYQTMVEATSQDPEAIYMMFARDGMLAKKNAYILKSSGVLKDDPTPANFARSLVANIALEGIYFYTAFLTFYALARLGLMTASADQIKYINRDEGGTHLDLFANIHREFKRENPDLYDAKFYEDAAAILKGAAELEIEWGTYNIDGGWPGYTASIVTDFVKWLTNERAALIGIPAIYPGAENPVPWFEAFSTPNSGRSNFFESKPTDYAVGGSLAWDD